MGADYLQQCKELITRQTGIVLEETHRAKTAERVLHTALQATGLADYEQLFARLSTQRNTSALWTDIVQGLTIGETYFFRNASYMRALQEQVIPNLIMHKRQTGQQTIRIWSAGCSTGEEIYTLVMILRDQIVDLDHWDLVLLGTDINPSYLERARQGIYRSHSFRSETPKHVQQRWFDHKPDGYHIKPALKQMVRFQPLNLLEGPYTNIGQFDLIMCRNVTIYFEPQMTKVVLNHIWQVLNNDGWLILGHSEAMLLRAEDINANNFQNAIFYQRAHPVPKTTSQIKTHTKQKRPVRPHKPKTQPNTSARANRRTAPKPPEKQPRLSAETLYQQARQAADNARWDEALGYLHKAEAKNNLNPQLYYLRALIYREMHQIDDAFASLRKALYCNPNFVMAHYLMGELQEANGAMRDAKREWRLAMAALANRQPTEMVAGEDDLSVDMLRGLIDYKLKANGG